MNGALTPTQQAKRRQRHVFALGAGAAMIPITCQIVAALIIWLDGRTDFPKADQALFALEFWDVQMVLLCIAIASSTLVDVGKYVIDQPLKQSSLALLVGLLLGLFVVMSICFSATLFSADLAASVAILMLFLGAIILALSYVIDMQLALLALTATA